MRYSQAKKTSEHEICKEVARSLYDKNLAQCDFKAAKSLSGGALGLTWLEMVLVLFTAVAGQYVVRLLQGWVIVRTAFLKKDHEE